MGAWRRAGTAQDPVALPRGAAVLAHVGALRTSLVQFCEAGASQPEFQTGRLRDSQVTPRQLEPGSEPRPISAPAVLAWGVGFGVGSRRGSRASREKRRLAGRPGGGHSGRGARGVASGCLEAEVPIWGHSASQGHRECQGPAVGTSLGQCRVECSQLGQRLGWAGAGVRVTGGITQGRWPGAGVEHLDLFSAQCDA